MKSNTGDLYLKLLVLKRVAYVLEISITLWNKFLIQKKVFEKDKTKKEDKRAVRRKAA
ncbi:hypothetical protein [Enterococcus sp. AZ109]|uniref:hypothetical protein n=1 Tax=Enterococcus sp. AZ109 TaxID=2774634 RepID=UPI003F25FD6E